MDQKKIGEFIAKLRKEKNLTQEELADKLNVNSKTVSRWENGNNMPDYSILNSLCEEFDINVLELLNGEKKKADNKVFEEYMKYKDKANKRKRILYLIIIFLLVIVSILGIYFLNNYKKVAVYRLNAVSNNFSYTDGILLKSNIKYVMKYGKLVITNHDIKEEDIVDVEVAYKNDDRYYLVTSYKDGATIIEEYGYGEVFNEKNIKHIPNDLYLIIFYKVGDKIVHEEIAMEVIEEMNNNKIINIKEKSGFKNNTPREIDLTYYDSVDNYKDFLLKNGFVEVDKDHCHTMCSYNCLEKEIGKNEYISFSYVAEYVSYYFENDDVIVKASSPYDDNSKDIQLRYQSKKNNERFVIRYDFNNGLYNYYGKEKEYLSSNIHFVDNFNKYRIYKK